MKIIALEEHYGLPLIYQAAKDANDPVTQIYAELIKAGKFTGDPTSKAGFPSGIYDLGDARIAAMDEAGIDAAVLSYPTPNVQSLEPNLATELAKQANDTLAAAMARYPERLLGFATLPMLDPKAAADELERCVRELGFRGTLINSNVNGRYFDDPFFWPVFRAAEALGAPVYLHPQIPPKPVVDAYYGGFAPEISGFLSIAGVGWHVDTGLSAIRMMLGGLFDRFPSLQVIVGHHFEILSWSAWRLDYSFPLGKNGGLKRTIRDYLRENFYGGILCGEYVGEEPGAIDSSWSLSYQAFLSMANTIGIDRVVYTTDYPYGDMKSSKKFFDQMPNSPNDKEKIAHLNAERLLGLGKTNGRPVVALSR